MRISNTVKVASLVVAFGAPFVLSGSAFAAADGVVQAQNFMKNMINVLAGFGGILATGFLVWGGIMYITSSGNIQNLEKSKTIIKFAAIGLVIVIAASAIVNFVSTSATDAFKG